MTSSRDLPARRDATARGGWTDDTVETLKRLWGEPDLSAAVIAQRLGVTRNAVLGKIHRLGLSKPRALRPLAKRTPEPRPRRLPRPCAVVPVAAMARPQAVAPERLEVGPGLVPHLEDLPRRACHWPLGDPQAADFTFCGRFAETGPYCPAHAAVAYRGRGVDMAELARLLRR
jgi:GcrA cell cycle regulator